MLAPRLLCRKHLPGEPDELHMPTGSLQRGTRRDGFMAKRLLDPPMANRHDLPAREMSRRDYAHRSPLPDCAAARGGSGCVGPGTGRPLSGLRRAHGRRGTGRRCGLSGIGPGRPAFAGVEPFPILYRNFRAVGDRRRATARIFLTSRQSFSRIQRLKRVFPHARRPAHE